MPTVFEYQVSLRWRDVDALGHVSHAVFLTYLEEGRDAFYVQALGRDPHYVVARATLTHCHSRLNHELRDRRFFASRPA